VFTGIVQEIGIIKEIAALSTGLAFQIQTSFASLVLGESIAVDGTCLTVTDITRQGFWCELSPESLSKTIAKNYRENSQVNLERALKLGDSMGGHWVSGHVDGTVDLSQKQIFDDFWKLTFSGVESQFRGYLMEKGSVTLNGISLTINDVRDSEFDVMIIPHTLERTTLKQIKLKDCINVEFDSMAKLIVQTVERYLINFSPK